MNTDSFQLRHIGPRESDHNQMLKTVGIDTLDQLITETIPDNIRLLESLNLDNAMRRTIISLQSLWEFLRSLRENFTPSAQRWREVRQVT